MQLSDFDFDLSPALIARFPTAKRSESRLLCVDQADAELRNRHFSDILGLVEPGDLLVFNDTKVIPARMLGRKATGGQVEVLVERIIDNKRIYAQIRASKSPRPRDEIIFNDNIRFSVVGRQQLFYELIYQDDDRTILEVIESIGQIPLPPYMHRAPEESDKERYQTVYAKHKGSVAAPTAGFHFDDGLLNQLKAKDVEMAYLTLHIGAGTFAPIRVDDIKTHQMHAEYLEVSPALCEQIRLTKARGKRVIAVGTTTLRALETASQSGVTQPFYGDTNIFIYPGYTFHCVDALITNLHLPRSTLLMLVCAFGGYHLMMQAYRDAVKASYRFYSYGDAMWVPRQYNKDDIHAKFTDNISA